MNLIPGLSQRVAFRAKFALLELNQRSQAPSPFTTTPRNRWKGGHMRDVWDETSCVHRNTYWVYCFVCMSVAPV